MNSLSPNVLSDPSFTVVSGKSKATTLSLAALLTRLLIGDEVRTFPMLTAEQHGHVWRFWVRCAAKAVHEIGTPLKELARLSPEDLTTAIQTELSALVPDGAWLLYQPDPGIPGFLQIPTPNGELPGIDNNYKSNGISLLTCTIGGKAHERKPAVVRELTSEQTVYALIEYQFSAVYAGRGNYETQLCGSRSGAGSGVPLMGARIAGSTVETFRHDVKTILDRWSVTAAQREGSIWALWSQKWDGSVQLGSQHLDPSFIPVARMIRLAKPENGLSRIVWFRPTEAGRVRDHTDGGVLGDPLTPLVPDPKTGDPKVRGTLRKGYDYTEVVRLLFGTDEQGGNPSASVQALAGRAELGRRDLSVLFEGIAYEQGKTGGYHRREVLLPTSGGRDVATWLHNPDPVRKAHSAMYGAVRDAKSALRGAARILLSGTPRPREGDAAKVEVPAAILERAVDAAYLEHLFNAAAAFDAGREDWLTPWLRWLTDETEKSFQASHGTLPTSTGQRMERAVSAEAFLSRKLRTVRGEEGPKGVDEAGPAHVHESELETSQ